MDAIPTPVCSCCGTSLPDADRIDVRFLLPDAVLEAPEEAREKVNGWLLRVAGAGAFARCLLPVRLSGGTELVIGTWLRVDEDDLRRAAEVHESPEYADLVLRGTLANAIRPWGDGLLSAGVTARVRDTEEIPYAETSDDALAGRILGETWDRDEVLRAFGHPLPVAVRARLDENWSIERSAGLAGRVENSTHQFGAQDRAVYVDVFTDHDRRPAEEFLEVFVAQSPPVPEDQRLTERAEDGTLRHAFWHEGPDDAGRIRQNFYGFVVRPGSALVMGCFFDEAELLPWARHVWRSAAYTEG
ncbi:DUF2199 domain-containing protein [Streptomyces sp. NPDC051940]|uniref:DUF2199 domain-containing protein n=1 Tax=Streptomyces sp. NPDC051940 TaxID=3155675 RepID=UPI003425C397